MRRIILLSLLLSPTWFLIAGELDVEATYGYGTLDPRFYEMGNNSMFGVGISVGLAVQPTPTISGGLRAGMTLSTDLLGRYIETPVLVWLRAGLSDNVSLEIFGGVRHYGFFIADTLFDAGVRAILGDTVPVFVAAEAVFGNPDPAPRVIRVIPRISVGTFFNTAVIAGIRERRSAR